MITFYNPHHALHQGKLEMFRGELVPCFEVPARVDYVLAELQRRALGDLLAHDLFFGFQACRGAQTADEIVAKIGQNVGYHCKPYATEEILQLATKAVNDYNKLRNLENLIAIISNINVSKSHLDSLLQNIPAFL